MEVYREILPESYLLILADDIPSRFARQGALDLALRRAVRSGKSSVWVDCSHLQHLPPDAADLLVYYHDKFAEYGMHLVLCHLTDTVQRELETLSPAHVPVVSTLLDAERYCLRPRTARAHRAQA